MSAFRGNTYNKDMKYGSLRVDDNPIDLDQIEEESIFADEISDDALEAAASGPTVTFTLSVVLFACQFCPQGQ
jgi:hypothetical protein